MVRNKQYSGVGRYGGTVCDLILVEPLAWHQYCTQCNNKEHVQPVTDVSDCTVLTTDPLNPPDITFIIERSHSVKVYNTSCESP